MKNPFSSLALDLDRMSNKCSSKDLIMRKISGLAIIQLTLKVRYRRIFWEWINWSLKLWNSNYVILTVIIHKFMQWSSS